MRGIKELFLVESSGVVLVKILPGNIDLSKIEVNVLCRSVGYKQLPCDVLYMGVLARRSDCRWYFEDVNPLFRFQEVASIYPISISTVCTL
jgi:hypothetical protein